MTCNLERPLPEIFTVESTEVEHSVSLEWLEMKLSRAPHNSPQTTLVCTKQSFAPSPSARTEFGQSRVKLIGGSVRPARFP